QPMHWKTIAFALTGPWSATIKGRLISTPVLVQPRLKTSCTFGLRAAIFRTWPQVVLKMSANSALQRAAFGIKCQAAGGRAPCTHEQWCARVLSGHLAVAELGS